MVRPGDILHYEEMARAEGKALQKGMNFRPRGKTSVFLMSRRTNAPYDDQLEEDGRVLIYQGHDDHKTAERPDPSLQDQPTHRGNGKLSDNGKFLTALKQSRESKVPERVRVYEKLATGIWVFNGEFALEDAWQEHDGRRSVWKFKLRLFDSEQAPARPVISTRVIPSAVKAEVWKRDGGKCVLCGEANNLHFDHELPFSKGGASYLAANIRILCARHNLAKGARIE